MSRIQVQILLLLACAWLSLANGRATAAPLAPAASTSVLTQTIGLVAARAVSSKKAKPRARHTRRAAAKRHRKLAHGKRRWNQPAATSVAHRRAATHCKARRRARRCRAHSPLDEAYVPPTATLALTAPVEAIIGTLPRPQTGTPDIVEREDDIPLIIQIAQTLAGNRVEHALSIVETRDTDTGQISYRIVPGDESKRTPDMAELPDVFVRHNERIVADIHSHPTLRARGQSVADKLIAARATQTNMYPGDADYAAVEKRGTVSAILNPNGTVFLLRRVAGAPSIRVVEGEPLAPLDNRAARQFGLVYLYSQNYLVDGAWTRPTIEQTSHAAVATEPAQTQGFVTPAP